MSIMALTITRSKRNSVDGSRITAYRTVAFDNSYPAGGEPFDANAQCGLKGVEEVRIGAGLPAGFTVRYDYANKKLQLFGESTEASGAEVSPGTNPASETRPLTEFANTFDASGIDSLELIIKGTRS